jgi:hypothetical protein
MTGAVEPAGPEPGEGGRELPGEDRGAGNGKPVKVPEWGIDDRHREPYFDCPKMKRIPCCCCNACPLDPKYPILTVEPGDPDQKCRLSRPKRLAISANHPGTLKYHGYTVKEWNRHRAWERLSAREKERRRALLVEARARLHRPFGRKTDEQGAERGVYPAD